MSHGFAGYASMARSTFPMSARSTDFPSLGSVSGSRTFLLFPFVSRGNSLEHWSHVASRCVPSPQRRSNFSKLSPIKQ